MGKSFLGIQRIGEENVNKQGLKMKSKLQINKKYEIKFLGNYFNKNYGAGYDGSVFSLAAGCCNTLTASSCNGGVPKFIIVEKEDA